MLFRTCISAVVSMACFCIIGFSFSIASCSARNIRPSFTLFDVKAVSRVFSSIDVITMYPLSPSSITLCRKPLLSCRFAFSPTLISVAVMADMTISSISCGSRDTTGRPSDDTIDRPSISRCLCIISFSAFFSSSWDIFCTLKCSKQ